MYFKVSPYQEILEGIVTSLEINEGIIKLTGPDGAGKSALCMHLFRKLESEKKKVLYFVSHPKSAVKLQDQILNYLGISTNSNFTKALTTFLLDKPEGRRELYLIFDDAHLIDEQTFSSIRMLCNIQDDKFTLVKPIICGTSQLDTLLAKHSFRSIAQFVCQSFSLSAMTKEELQNFYWAFWVKQGIDIESPSEKTIASLHKKTKGLPGKVIAELERSQQALLEEENPTPVATAKPAEAKASTAAAPTPSAKVEEPTKALAEPELEAAVETKPELSSEPTSPPPTEQPAISETPKQETPAEKPVAETKPKESGLSGKTLVDKIVAKKIVGAKVVEKSSQAPKAELPTSKQEQTPVSQVLPKEEARVQEPAIDVVPTSTRTRAREARKAGKGILQVGETTESNYAEVYLAIFFAILILSIGGFLYYLYNNLDDNGANRVETQSSPQQISASQAQATPIVASETENEAQEILITTQVTMAEEVEASDEMLEPSVAEATTVQSEASEAVLTTPAAAASTPDSTLENTKTLASAEVSTATTPVSVEPESIEPESLEIGSIESIESFLTKWLAAWMNKDLDSYFSFYKEGYISPQMATHDAWVQQRISSITRASNMQISFEEIEVLEETDQSLNIRFWLVYNTDSYGDRTWKEMHFDFDGTSYLITSERNQRVERTK